MISLCKSCFFVDKTRSSPTEEDEEYHEENNQEIIEEEVKLAPDNDKLALLDEEEKVVQSDLATTEEKERKLSDHFEEDSGTCIDHSNSSEMLDNLVIDKVQLTVSSVNSILPDLPEHEDHEEEEDNNEEEKKPLILNKASVPSSTASLSSALHNSHNSTVYGIKFLEESPCQQRGFE